MTRNNHCAHCLFAQYHGNSLICRHRDIGQNLAANRGILVLTNEIKKADCPGFFSKRDVPKNSPLRKLIGPDFEELRLIVERSRQNRKDEQKALKLKQGSLF